LVLEFSGAFWELLWLIILIGFCAKISVVPIGIFLNRKWELFYGIFDGFRLLGITVKLPSFLLGVFNYICWNFLVFFSNDTSTDNIFSISAIF
jgi:hypothetical protein